MAISRQDVEHVAQLSRLQMSEQEAEKFTEQLNDVLNFARKLNELDTDEVEPTSHVLDMYNVLRKDEVQPSLSEQEALQNAPEHAQGQFKVPPVIE